MWLSNNLVWNLLIKRTGLHRPPNQLSKPALAVVGLAAFYALAVDLLFNSYFSSLLYGYYILSQCIFGGLKGLTNIYERVKW